MVCLTPMQCAVWLCGVMYMHRGVWFRGIMYPSESLIPRWDAHPRAFKDILFSWLRGVLHTAEFLKNLNISAKFSLFIRGLDGFKIQIIKRGRKSQDTLPLRSPTLQKKLFTEHHMFNYSEEMFYSDMHWIWARWGTDCKGLKQQKKHGGYNLLTRKKVQTAKVKTAKNNLVANIQTARVITATKKRGGYFLLTDCKG